MMNFSVSPLGLVLPDQSQIFQRCRPADLPRWVGTNFRLRDHGLLSEAADRIPSVGRRHPICLPSDRRSEPGTGGPARRHSNGVARLFGSWSGLPGARGQWRRVPCGSRRAASASRLWPGPRQRDRDFINAGTRALLIRADRVEVLPGAPPLGCDPALRYLPMVTTLQSGDILLALVDAGEEIEPELIDLMLTTREAGPQRRWRSAMELWAAKVAASSACDRSLFMLERSGLLGAAGGGAWSGECDSDIYESRARSGDVYLRFTLKLETGNPPTSLTPIEGGARE